MPYTRSGFPDAMKNLEKIVRVKAIDILNAMLEEGYEEGTAIPIAIDQAKEWKEDAGEKEQQQMLNKDLTEHEEDSNAARLQHADVRVSYNEDKESWQVQSEGAKQADSYHDTKKEAANRAKEIADNRDTNVVKEKKKD